MQSAKLIVNPYKIKNFYMGNLPHGKDLLAELTHFCSEKVIQTGILIAIGAVKDATVGYYNQIEKKYQTLYFNKHLEIASLNGNISEKDNKTMVHSHILLTDSEGKAFGGHLMPGTTIFACEFWIFELEGEKLIRGYDEVTGLHLWKMGD